MPEHSFLFVHSPLVGPSSMRRLALAASALGHPVALPDLTSMASRERPHNVYLEGAVVAAASLPAPLTVVGHSGAGAFMPAIANGIEDDPSLLFVDAVIPPLVGAHTTPDRMSDMLDAQTEDGVLHRWLDWWPKEVVAELLPEASDRDELAADMPRLPRSFYEISVEVPFGWSEAACAYLRLSDGYDAELEEARARHWPTATITSNHLGTHTDADRVLREILRLADQNV